MLIKWNKKGQRIAVIDGKEIVIGSVGIRATDIDETTDLNESTDIQDSTDIEEATDL